MRIQDSGCVMDHNIEEKKRIQTYEAIASYTYKDHKTEFIKYKINPAKLQEKAAKNMMRLEEQQEELDLRRKVRLLEANIKDYKRKILPMRSSKISS